MRFLAISAILALLASPAAAACYGTPAFQTCTDDSGNSYSIQRYGNTTTVQGSALNGSQWNQTSQTYGNQTYTNGMANGRPWNETQTRFGSGNSSIYGTNSHGKAYSYSCTAFGCN